MSAGKIVACVSGVFLLISGLIASAIALLSILDPVASKLADDGDPFGTPPSRLDSLLILLVYFGVSCVGAFLVWKSGRKPSASA
jgi:UPF0716 family protein affecting phage T7 exclusion